MSPSSMFARWTSPNVPPKALAMASSTRLSFRPIRRSPVMILTMYLASRGVACERSSRVRAALAAGPRAAAISRNLAATSRTFSAALPGFARPGRAGAPVPTWAVRKNGFRDVAKVSVLTIGCGEFGFVVSGKLCDNPPQHSSAYLQGGFLPDRKRPSREKYGRDGSLLRRARLEIFGDDRDLFEFLGGGGDALTGFSQLDHVLSMWARAPRSCVPGSQARQFS